MAFVPLVRAYGDWALALAVSVLFEVELWTAADAGVSAERAFAAAAGVLFPIALAWRRRRPLAVLALALGAMALRTAGPLDDPGAFIIGVLVTLYSVGAYTAGTRAIIGALGVAAFYVVFLLQEPGQVEELGDLMFISLIFGGPWLAGRAMHYRREREHALERRAVDLEREREEKARVAVAEERARIARELHDVVAHAISVMVVQARGGRRSLVTDPAETRGALDTIEATGSQALAEMRRLLGILRRDDEEIALAPQPSLRHLDALAARVTDAGLAVEVRIEGEPIELRPGVDLSAYRIVQEALTNALKHAGPAAARVVVRYGSDELELEIADTGRGKSLSDGGGHGLVGLRERVSIYGGRLEAGPAEAGGFTVRARLPLDSGRP